MLTAILRDRLLETKDPQERQRLTQMVPPAHLPEVLLGCLAQLHQGHEETARLTDQLAHAQAGYESASGSLKELRRRMEEDTAVIGTVGRVLRVDGGKPARLGVYLNGGLNIHGLQPELGQEKLDLIRRGVDVAIHRESGLVVDAFEENLLRGSNATVERVLEDGSLLVHNLEGHGAGFVVEPCLELLGRDLKPGTVVALKGADRLAFSVVIESTRKDQYLSVETPDVPWESWIHSRAKLAVERVIFFPRLHPDKYRLHFPDRRTHPTRILMMGPPGTGKTTGARAVATRLATLLGKEVCFIAYRPEWSSFYSETAAAVRRMFEAVKEIVGSGRLVVLFLDDADLQAGGSRSGNEYRSSEDNKQTLEMLTGLDGYEQKIPPDKILILAATNDPTALDSAIRRRIADEVIQVGYFDRFDAGMYVNRLLESALVSTRGRQDPAKVRQSLADHLTQKLFTASDDEALFRCVYRTSDRPVNYVRRQDLAVSGDRLAKLITRARNAAFARDAELSGPGPGLTRDDLDASCYETDRQVQDEIPHSPGPFAQSLFVPKELTNRLGIRDVAELVPVPRPMTAGAALRTA